MKILAIWITKGLFIFVICIAEWNVCSNLMNSFMKGILIEAGHGELIKPSTLYQNFILLGHIDTTPFALMIFFNGSTSVVDINSILQTSKISIIYSGGNLKISHTGVTARLMIFSPYSFSLNEF